jgi:hypothetical protein
MVTTSLKTCFMKADSCSMRAGAYAEKELCEAGGFTTAVEELKNAGALTPSNEVCKIGPGLGM